MFNPTKDAYIDPAKKYYTVQDVFTSFAGWWHFPGSTPACQTKFAVAEKPNWFKRLLVELVFGFFWEDKK